MEIKEGNRLPVRLANHIWSISLFVLETQCSTGCFLIRENKGENSRIYHENLKTKKIGLEEG